MKRLILVAALLAVSSPAVAREKARTPAANPSAVIAAELAFARLAQEKGQWTAYRETAASDAVTFQPQMVLVHQWVKDRPNPPTPNTWQPHQLWSSCDGTVVISHGAWQQNKQNGYYTTVWQRQKDGSYKWVLDHGDVMPMPIDAPEMIAAKVAECPPKPARRVKPPKLKKGALPPVPLFDPASRSGKSDDGTLVWSVSAEPSGAHNFSAEMRSEGQMGQILIEQVSAPEK